MKFEIVTDNIIYRYYEIEAENEEEALKKYYNELPDPVKERYGESGELEIRPLS